MPPAIIEEILKNLPAKADISETNFEGANIILYTKNKEFFLNQNDMIKKVVNLVKKRIELRPDPSIVLELEKAEEMIKKIIPKDSKITNIIFDAPRSVVIIEAEKPGLAIGKKGELLREIKKKTLWIPLIKRSPAIRSKIIENIRGVLYQFSDYRKKFLNKIGQEIYNGNSKDNKKEEWIRISVLGGGRQVGRSCFLLQTPRSRILLDCGVNTAATDQKAYPHFDSPDFKLEDIDAIILTHAHLDHGGFIPYLYKLGYKGPLYCTEPTRDILALLALDLIDVNFKQSGKTLYSAADIREMVKHTVCLDFEEVTDITPDIRITLYNSGHILGSSLIHLHIGNGLHNLMYTGDFKFQRTQLLEPASTKFPRLETVLMESTYGSKHDILESRKDTEQRLIETVDKTIKRGGKVLIPVLGVGRSQEVMLTLENAIRNNLIKKVPIYIQGMVWDITAIHTAYPDFLNKNVRKAIFHKDQNPFLSDIFKRVVSKKEQEQVIEGKPCIILSTAGFLNAGASVEYFKQLADNPKNTIIFVNYQFEGSLGKRVQNGEKDVQVSGGEKPEMIKVNMDVESFTSLSGHAGRNELMRFVQTLYPRPKKIIINHGESSKCLDLASSIYKSYRIETIAPNNLDCIRLR